jgi:hypothetical protein
MSQEYPDKPRRFKLQRNYHVVLVCLVNTLMGIPDCLSQSAVSQLLRVLPFFIEDTATEDFAEFFASLTAQMYGRFVLESKFGGRGSPMAILLDSEYILNDLYSCLSPISQLLRNIYNGDNFLTEVELAIERMRGEVAVIPQWTAIQPLYQTLFSQYFEKVHEMLMLWTILFSGGPDLRYYHLFAASIIINEQLPQTAEIPLVTWATKFHDKKEARPLSEYLCEIVELLREPDDETTKRAVSKFQTNEIMLCAMNQADTDEILPLRLMLQEFRQ